MTVSQASVRFSEEALRGGLARFIAGQGFDRVTVGPMKRYTVGFSWLTYGFTASWTSGGDYVTRDLILRIGPPDGVFAPYSARPEYLALSSLAASGVPVPKIYWYSDCLEVLGAPFFVCEKMEGEAPVPWTPDGGAAFSEGERLNLGNQFVSALAALHRFEWRGTPVEELPGARDPAKAAIFEIGRWERNMREWSERTYPMLEWALCWLRGNAPPALSLTIVHGDFRIGNFLEAAGRITAILDWELVHIGDPHEDLGWICIQAFRGRSPFMCHLLTRDELFESYEKATGSSVSRRSVHFYEAFATFKLAVIHLGAVFCFERRGFNDLRMAAMGSQIPRLLLQLEKVIEAAP
jgi:aminoglycoside phosphotransferase (APT) family kinase protein